MKSLLPEGLTFTEVKHLPIVKHFAQKINLVDTFDTLANSQMELSPGVAVLAMVLDTLSGRTPLYRLEEFLFEKDTELLLGTNVQPERFSDYNLGRVLDKIHQTGTQKVFSAFVTPNTLQSADQKNIKFLTRLPATYKKCFRAIGEAVAAHNWIEIGTLPHCALKPAASCCCATSAVMTVYGLTKSF